MIAAQLVSSDSGLWTDIQVAGAFALAAVAVVLAARTHDRRSGKTNR